MLNVEIIAPLLLLALAAMTPSSVRAETERISYSVSFNRCGEQLVDIAMTLRDWDQPTLDLHLPVWRPGRYEVLEQAGTIRAITAADSGGAQLALEKTAKSSWRIATPARGDITVTYQLYANSLNNRTRHVDDSHAFLSGAGVFLYCEQLRDSPLTVKLDVRPGWKIASGLTPDATRANTLLATDYDMLVDSPIEVGVQTERTIEVAGTPHRFIFWGRTDVVPEQLFYDAEKIIQTQHDFFGTFPHTHYTFLTHIAPGLGGGTEHVNSTVIQCRPTAFASPKDYRDFLSLISHEFFHTWNVKNFRPEGLKPYDYTKENYTKLLWVAEGATSYYDELLCVRAGVWTPDQYLEALAKVIDSELSRPGGGVQSLESSSFDAWIKFNRPNPDSINSTVSFYSKGALVNLMLDCDIRARTGNAANLDDVMRTLNREFPLTSPHAYSASDLLRILHDLTGSDYKDFFDAYVRGTQPLDIAAALRTLGLEFTRVAAEGDPKERAYLGLDVRDADSGSQVSAVRSDSPAAGSIIADDLIIAIDQLRVRGSDLDSRIKSRKPGDRVRLTFFRREEMRSIEVTLAPRPAGSPTIKRVATPTPEQKAAYESWMGAPWPTR
jgi:predicted metalloprotease with PDZ domain